MKLIYTIDLSDVFYFLLGVLLVTIFIVVSVLGGLVNYLADTLHERKKKKQHKEYDKKFGGDQDAS